MIKRTVGLISILFIATNMQGTPEKWLAHLTSQFKPLQSSGVSQNIDDALAMFEKEPAGGFFNLNPEIVYNVTVLFLAYKGVQKAINHFFVSNIDPESLATISIVDQRIQAKTQHFATREEMQRAATKDELHGAKEMLNRVVNAQGARQDTAEGRIKATEDGLQALNLTVSTQGAKIGELLAAQAKHAATLAVLNEALEGTTSKPGIYDRLDGLDLKTTTLSGSVTGLQTSVSALKTARSPDGLEEVPLHAASSSPSSSSSLSASSSSSSGNGSRSGGMSLSFLKRSKKDGDGR